MIDLPLTPPGLVVNPLKGDLAEHRANGWLEWDGGWAPDIADRTEGSDGT